VATFGDLNVNRSGAGYTLVASSGTLTAATSSAFDVSAAAASALEFSAQPSNATAGLSIARRSASWRVTPTATSPPASAGR